jgi:hypothetical protein
MTLERGPTKGMLTICSQLEPAITGCGELVYCTHARVTCKDIIADGVGDIVVLVDDILASGCDTPGTIPRSPDQSRINRFFAANLVRHIVGKTGIARARIPAFSLDSQDQTFRDAPLVHCTGYRRNWAPQECGDVVMPDENSQRLHIVARFQTQSP